MRSVKDLAANNIAFGQSLLPSDVWKGFKGAI